MSPALRGNVRMAWASIKSTRWRSGFTMLGVIVAVVPVLTILGIGEGVKRQITDQIAQFGTDMITVRPGAISENDNPVTQFQHLRGFTTGGTFSKEDYDAVRGNESIEHVAPLGIVPGQITLNDEQKKEAFVMASTSELPDLFDKTVRHGEFFTEDEQSRRVAVVGREAATEIFGQEIPLGRAFEFRGQTFIVRGVFEKFDIAPLSFSVDFNKAVIIPYDVATNAAGDVPIYEMLARPADGVSLQQASDAITKTLKERRGGSHDFSVLTQAENLRVANRILSLLTALVASVAIIALLVAGIGIMNIMLVSVTERMHEIGVRKAIGASKRQILGQFMWEAILLSLAGGVIGIIFSFVVQYFIRLFTQLQPVITWQATVLVAGISLFVGVVFGSIPALKAARKDPIEALRHE